MKYLLIVFIVFSLVSCSDDLTSTFLDCQELSDDYKLYNDEVIDCEFHFILTKYDGQNYIELVAHCADLVRPYVYDENCEDICAPVPGVVGSHCSQYLREREVLEILLIEK